MELLKPVLLLQLLVSYVLSFTFGGESLSIEKTCDSVEKCCRCFLQQQQKAKQPRDS